LFLSSEFSVESVGRRAVLVCISYTPCRSLLKNLEGLCATMEFAGLTLCRENRNAHRLDYFFAYAGIRFWLLVENRYRQSFTVTTEGRTLGYPSWFYGSINPDYGSSWFSVKIEN